MLRTRDGQMSILDALVPPFLRRLPEELAVVDKFLDDDRFLAPFVEAFDETMGRPTVPVERYLRLMYLKHRYGLGYETLCQAVNDSYQWRLFCRISLDAPVPHPTTLSKLTHKYGEDTVRELHETLVLKMAEEKLIKGNALRFDTTVMEANIEHPTDADLLNDGVRYIHHQVKKLGSLVDRVADGYRSGTRTAKGILWDIGAKLKSRAADSQDVVKALTGKMVGVAGQVLKQTQPILERAAAQAQGENKQSRKVARAVEKLQDAIGVTTLVVDQTLKRLAGEKSIPNRIVSIFDREARAILRGKLSKPVEFGYKVNLHEVEGGVISGFDVFVGNPADVTMSVDVVKRHKQMFGHAPSKVATDKGFTSTGNEAQLKQMGVKKVSMPVRGKRSARRDKVETSRWFRELQRWRAGAEATISRMKRRYGLNRTYLRGHSGAGIWVGFAVFTHNLARLVKLKPIVQPQPAQ